MFLFAMGQIVPLGVITFSYVNIIRTLKKNSQRLGRVSRAETRATAMVFIMIIAFTVAWTPYSLFALMEQFATEGIFSPGAGVIPALVAKSSICYDPLIYVGMNSQFRQSIKRVFGMHNKGKQSQTERAYNNTVLSPAHKASINNETTRYISESTVSIIPKKVKDTKRIVFSESISEVVNNDTNRPYTRDLELCTINENRTISDADKSGETSYDEDSGNSRKKLDLFGESCKIFNKRSPVLTIIDTERLIYSKPLKHKLSDIEDSNNAYGNAAYEEHSTDTAKADGFRTEDDFEIVKRHKRIKHSYSLDLSVHNENKNRKLSIESKFDTLVEPKGFFKDSYISKFFDPETSQDGVKSYICNVKGKGKFDNNL
ncbi:unnamed protein product [Diatraea saccharalis]|uniref:G-protein coupled receptors family 1 profile domain-containing protein n=1 Tax=Diatraea saccharalis TaxID=40085 RepID=A0A9N9R2N3_9NEOP|nr:unnamed protein product [Diatraea saccharalis]